MAVKQPVLQQSASFNIKSGCKIFAAQVASSPVLLNAIKFMWAIRNDDAVGQTACANAACKLSTGLTFGADRIAAIPAVSPHDFVS